VRLHSLDAELALIPASPLVANQSLISSDRLERAATLMVVQADDLCGT
jgi:hypothetical protein